MEPERDVTTVREDTLPRDPARWTAEARHRLEERAAIMSEGESHPDILRAARARALQDTRAAWAAEGEWQRLTSEQRAMVLHEMAIRCRA